MSIDRSAVSRALAKALAFKACGKDAEALNWARELVCLLECADILREEMCADLEHERALRRTMARKDGAA